jgi:hypothetical protein
MPDDIGTRSVFPETGGTNPSVFFREQLPTESPAGWYGTGNDQG